MMFADNGLVDETGRFTLFGQIVSQLEDRGQSKMKNFKLLGTDEQPFKLKFMGEGGIDAGGLFRDAIVNIA